MYKNIILTLCVLSGFCLKAQVNLDSLFAVWKDPAQADSVRTMAYKDYIFKGFMFSKPDTAFVLAGELITYSQKKDYRKGEAFGINLQGISNQIQGNYSKALEYYKRSLRIREEIEDENGKAISLNNIGLVYSDQNNYLKALEYQERSLNVRKKLGDKKEISGSLNNIGLIYWEQGNYSRALDLFERSLKIDVEIGDKNGIASSLNNIGIIYQDHGNNPKALEYYQRSLKIEEEIGDKNGIARSLNNIGIIYNFQSNYPQALDYHLRSLKIKEEIGDKNGIASSLNNIGIIYQGNGNKTKALEYYKRSLKIEEEIGNKNGIAISLNDIGGIYDSEGNYPQALDYYHSSLKIREEIGDKKGIAQSLGNIGMIHKKHGKYHDALIECQRSLTLSEEIESIELQKSACSCLYETFKAMGNGNEALSYHEQMLVLKDSLFNEENTKKLTRLEMQYSFDNQMLADSLVFAKKEALSKMELEKSENTNNALIGGSGLLMLLVGFIFYGYRQKRKANRFLEERNKFEIENKKRAIALFSQQVSKEVAMELLSDTFETGSKKIFACIMFLDIRGFTPFVENKEPSEIIQYQNDVFGFMIDIISKHNGIINQFLGDGFMATFGAPASSGNDCQNAVNASLEIVKLLNQKCKSGEVPKTKIGIGLHAGNIVTGNVGTTNRKQYSITGNTVILASRIEQLNKEFDSEVLISKEVLEMLDQQNLKVNNLGRIDVKGRSEPMEIVRLV